MFKGRNIWNVNSTAHGGGVAEMLAALLPYARGSGVDARWLVIGGDNEFFHITKRIHNLLHGASGDGDGLTDDDRRHYEDVLADQARQLKTRTRDGDFVILHDPQTAGLVPSLVDAGLLDDPRDRQAFADAVCRLLNDPASACTMGEAAKARVQREFLGSRHLAQYVEICGQLV